MAEGRGCVRLAVFGLSTVDFRLLTFNLGQKSLLQQWLPPWTYLPGRRQHTNLTTTPAQQPDRRQQHHASHLQRVPLAPHPGRLLLAPPFLGLRRLALVG